MTTLYFVVLLVTQLTTGQLFPGSGVAAERLAASPGMGFDDQGSSRLSDGHLSR